METLVEIAKRLGVKPNPKVNDMFYYQEHYLWPICKGLEKTFGKRPKHMGGVSSFDDVYVLYKYSETERSWNKKKAAQQVRYLKTTARPSIKIHDQDNHPVKLGDDSSFVWHTSPNEGPTKERFQIDLKMDSPHMEQMWQKLDDFIIKHRASFKVTDLDGKERHDRTDTLNIYMSEDITPEITEELYGIVGPFLEPKYDEFLAGFPVKLNGKAVKGFRYGPEPIDVGNKKRKAYADYVKKVALQDLPPFFADLVENRGIQHRLSLGELSAIVQAVDLIYYLAGKEGKSPFQIGNQFGEPNKPKYTKIIDIGTGFQHPLVRAPAPRVPTKPAPQKVPTPPRRQQTPQSPVDKLKPQRFVVGKTGVSGCKYLDAKGNVIITETYHPNCVKRVYANGLTMHMWHNPQSTTYTDGAKTGKASTEIIVTEMGCGCTKDVTTSGALKRKIEEVRKAGLLVTTLPDTPKRTGTIKGRMMRHSVDTKRTVTRTRMSGKVSAA